MKWIFALLGYEIGKRQRQKVVYVNQAALDRQRNAKRNFRLILFLVIGGLLFWFWYLGAPHQ